jgi:hypothetical protein
MGRTRRHHSKRDRPSNPGDTIVPTSLAADKACSIPFNDFRAIVENNLTRLKNLHGRITPINPMVLSDVVERARQTYGSLAGEFENEFFHLKKNVQFWTNRPRISAVLGLSPPPPLKTTEQRTLARAQRVLAITNTIGFERGDLVLLAEKPESREWERTWQEFDRALAPVVEKAQPIRLQDMERAVASAIKPIATTIDELRRIAAEREVVPTPNAASPVAAERQDSGEAPSDIELVQELHALTELSIKELRRQQPLAKALGYRLGVCGRTIERCIKSARQRGTAAKDKDSVPATIARTWDALKADARPRRSVPKGSRSHDEEHDREIDSDKVT